MKPGKFSIFFCFILFASFSQATTKLFDARSIAELNQRLSQMSFHDVLGARYDSAIWTGVAALETRAYPWTRRWWRSLNLVSPFADDRTYYSAPVPAYYYENNGDKLIIIFGTSFGTFGSGTWYRKMISRVRAIHPDTSFLIFPGYLSKETLENAKPKFPDPGVRFVACDYWERIEYFLSQEAARGKIYNKIGSIGFSGGASIVLRLMQFKSQIPNSRYLDLNWGNLSLSPVLNAEAAAEVVDEQARFLESKGAVNRTFDIGDWAIWRFIGSFIPFSKDLNAKYMFDLTRNPDSYKFKRVQSLVAYSVIHDMRKVIERQSPDYVGPIRMKNYYEDYAYPKVLSHMGPEQLSYAQFSSFEDAALVSRGPLRVVFSEDDPILSVKGVIDPEEAAHPSVDRVLTKYERNPRVTVDRLRFGGHIGYLVETDYIDGLLRETFR